MAAPPSATLPPALHKHILCSWKHVFDALQHELQACDSSEELPQTLVQKLDVATRNLARFGAMPVSAQHTADKDEPAATKDDDLQGLRIVG